MTTTDRSLKSLTAGADPVGWLAAADLHEERGEDELASLWRLRADVLTILLEVTTKPPASGEDITRYLNNQGRIWFFGTPKRVSIVLYGPHSRVRLGHWHAKRESVRPENVRWLRRAALDHAERLLAAQS